MMKNHLILRSTRLLKNRFYNKCLSFSFSTKKGGKQQHGNANNNKIKKTKKLLTKQKEQYTETTTNNTINGISSFSIGTIAGLLGSLAGMGGGFVMIPLMTQWLHLRQHVAHGTSLVAVGTTGLAGAYTYGHDFIHYEAAVVIGLSAMVTARWGAAATAKLSEQSLRRALGILILCMAPLVPLKAHYIQRQQQQQEKVSQQQQQQQILDNNNISPFSHYLYHWGPPTLIGMGSGFLSGLLGVGGGVLVVPALSWISVPSSSHDDAWRFLNHYEALATSLAAMTLPAMAGTWTHAQHNHVAWRVAPFLAMGSLVGAHVGGKWIGKQTSQEWLQWEFSGLLFLLGTRTLLLRK